MADPNRIETMQRSAVRPFDAGARGSLWTQTAGPATPCPALRGAHRTAVAVVGAGYTGLSAALSLLEHGVDVTVLDVAQPGHGASGRNGGQVVPALRHEPRELERRFGLDAGRAMTEIAARSADRVFELVERHGIECDAVRTGWIQGARGQRAIDTMRARMQAWREVGSGTRWLDADEIARLSGSSEFAGGWMLAGGGSVHPLKYARGLAGAVQRHGGRIFGDSAVLSLAPQGGRWKLGTAQGEVHADQVVLATNGYTDDLWPGLKQTVVPLYSMQVASEPLTDASRSRLLPGNQTMTDSRHLVHYFRKDRDGRFVIGARGPYTEDPDSRAGERLIAMARRLFPELSGVAFPYRWAGRVAMTTDHLPHLHRLADGLTAALGYNGRGVAMATMMGTLLAAACTDGKVDPGLGYPITDMSPIPFHRAHRWGLRAVIGYYRTLDLIG